MALEVTKIVLKDVRFGYEHLFEPSSSEDGGVKKYSLEIRISKDTAAGQAQYAEIQKAVEKHTDIALKASKLKDKKTGAPKLDPKFEVCFYDGDETDKTGYEGCWFFSAKSANPVGIFSTEKDEKDNWKQIGRNDIKGGDYGNVSVGMFYFEKGDTGISFFLNSVQKKRDGIAIAQGVSSADFDDLEDVDNFETADEVVDDLG